jgi:ribosomal protein S18 acetylase RimI-like enzyme
MITYTFDISAVDWDGMKARLVADNFDNHRTPEQYKVSFENSALCCLAYDGDELVGTVRALSDGVCNAYIVDVWTYTPYRRQGIAAEMMRRTMERLPGQHVYLFTDDAVGFYEKLGFQPQEVGMGLVVGEWLKNT